MNLFGYKKPIYHTELTFLITKCIYFDFGKSNILKEEATHSPEKILRINHISPGFLDDYKIMIEESSPVALDHKRIINIHKHYSFGTFTKIMYQINDLDFDNLNLNKFIKASITSMVLSYEKNEINDRKKIEKEIHNIYNEESLNFSNLFDFVNKLDISQSEKYKALEFFKDISSIFNELLDLLVKLKPIYDNFYNKHLKLINNFYKEKSLNNITDLPISQWIDIESFDHKILSDFYFSFSLVNYNGITVKISTLKEGKSLILYGVFHDLFEKIEKEDHISVDDIEFQMNALGDSKRLKIFSLLLEKEYYLKELADSLDLTSSTLSHHMDILSSAGLVKLRSKGKKIYYSINSKQTKLISTFFDKVTNKIGEQNYDDKRTTI